MQRHLFKVITLAICALSLCSCSKLMLKLTTGVDLDAIENADRGTSNDPSSTYDETTHTLTSPKGELKLYFPSDPRKMQGKHHGLSASTQFFYNAPSISYEVAAGKFFTMTGSSRKTDIETIVEGSDVWLRRMHATKNTQNPITLGVFPGRQIKGVTGHSGTFEMHTFADVPNKRLFILTAYGDKAQVESSETKRFFDSLVILPATVKETTPVPVAKPALPPEVPDPNATDDD